MAGGMAYGQLHLAEFESTLSTNQPTNQPTQEQSCLKQHLIRTDIELRAKETSVNQNISILNELLNLKL